MSMYDKLLFITGNGGFTLCYARLSIKNTLLKTQIREHTRYHITTQWTPLAR